MTSQDQSKRRPDTEGTAPLPRPRRIQPNRQRSSSKKQQGSESADQNDIRTMKEQQNNQVQSRENQKIAEEAATLLAKETSVKESYDSSRWEGLVSKQEELMGSFSDHTGDSKPKSKRRPNSKVVDGDTVGIPKSKRRPNANTTTRAEPLVVAGDAPQWASLPAPLPGPRGQEQVLPGAYRMRPSVGATPARGLEEGDQGDPIAQESRRNLTEKEESIRNDMLIEAELVSDTEMPSSSSTNSSRRQEVYPEPELVMGEPMSLMKPPMAFEEDDERSRRLRWILIAVCLLVTFLIVIGSALGVQASKDKKDDETAEVSYPAELVTMAPTPFTQSVLPPYTQEALNDPTSPQAQAYAWLSNDLEANEDQDMNSFFPLQRFVLATLYYSMQGSTWKDKSLWLEEGTDPCDWHTTFYAGICTNGRRRRNLRVEVAPRRFYQHLSLWQNNLAGTLPPEIGLLTKLDVFDLHGNAISGPIPSQLGLWQDVTFVQLFNNSLTGTLPRELSQLTQIKELNFAFNRLTGTVPNELAQLSPTLKVFSVSNNRLTGTIPSQVGLLTRLQGLHLYANPHLGGTIPSEVGQMAQLQKLHLNGIGHLTGTMPAELGRLSMLQEVQLEDTKIRGSIPSELGSLSQLTKLTLHRTELTGILPLEVCALRQSGILRVLSVDCEKVRCPRECQCDCFDARTEDQAISAAPQPIVIEGVTSPPITVQEPVGEAPEHVVRPAVTSTAVDGSERPATSDDQ